METRGRGKKRQRKDIVGAQKRAGKASLDTGRGKEDSKRSHHATSLKQAVRT